MKTIGIAGGMGPAAAVRFAGRLVALTAVSAEQEHIETVLYNAPAIPDRSAYITGRSGVSPLPAMVSVFQKLETLCDFIVFPCVTAHHFYEQLAASVSLPVPDMQQLTADKLSERRVKRVGLLSTDGTLKSGRFQRLLTAAGLQVLVPEAPQAVMELIYKVKTGHPPDKTGFHRIAEKLTNKGAETIILGCTELSFFCEDSGRNGLCTDPLEILARESILAAGGTPID